MCAFSSSSSSSSDSSSWQKSSSRQYRPRSCREMKSMDKITVNEFLKEEEEQQQQQLLQGQGPLGRWFRRAFSSPEVQRVDGEDATFLQPSSSEQPRPRRTRVFRWLHRQEQRLLQVLLPSRRHYQWQADEEEEEGQWLENFDAFERQNVFTRLREIMVAAFTRQ
jgi:hypothetical protein